MTLYGEENLQLIKNLGSLSSFAGSSLLTLALRLFLTKNIFLIQMKNEIIKSLASCSGHTGIAGGQELDLKFENKKKILIKLLTCKEKDRKTI